MHDELTDVRAALGRPPATLEDPSASRAAVAALFTPGRRLWFIRRAERLGDPWSGQLAFPGGWVQASDRSPQHAAMRETWEEVGVDLADAELLGQLDDLRSRPVTSLVIRPFVFRLAAEPAWRLNHEVAGVVSLGLDTLLADDGRGTMRWPPVVGMSLPCVDFDGHRLWGLTLRMVDDLLHRLDGRGVGLDRTQRPR